MFWMLLAILVIAAFILALSRRRRYESTEDEPWRASLRDDEPLDMEAARQAEEEWLADSGWQDEDDNAEQWRG